MAKKKETEALPSAQTLRTADPPTTPAPAQASESSAPASEETENGANNQNTPLSDQVNKLGEFIMGLDCGYPRATEAYPAGMSATEAAEEYIKELRADVLRLSEDHANACAMVAQMRAVAVGEVTGPKRGVVEDVEDVINTLRARVAELEAGQVQHTGSGSAPPADDQDLAAEAYDLFRKSQAEGEFPAWAELPEQTQKLWRDSYTHVAAGGEPRTDYEEAVKYLINSAQ